MPEFDTENQPSDEARKPRGKGKKSMMLEAIRAECNSEADFLRKVVKAAIGSEQSNPPIPPNTQLMTLVLQRIEAPLKSTSPLIEFDFPESGSPTTKAMAIIKSISMGALPTDIGKELIGIIKDAVVIEEGTDLKLRIEELEKTLGLVND